MFDRVVARDVNGQKLVTVYDGQNPWADFDGAGGVVAKYLYGDRADEVLARWTPAGGQAWYLADKQGTVRDLVDATGAVVGHRDYDAFGAIVDSDGAVDRFAFQGREWEAAAGLYQFRARWYDPGLRQFTSDDPLGFAAGDSNLKRFVSNNPNTYTDPSGMVADYGLLAQMGTRKGAAVAGAVLGYLCGYLDGLFSDGTEAEREARAAREGFYGWLVGGAVGYALGPVGMLYPTAAFGVGAVATVAWASQPGNSVQKAVRLGCFLVPVAAASPVTRGAVRGAADAVKPWLPRVGQLARRCTAPKGDGAAPGCGCKEPQPGGGRPVDQEWWGGEFDGGPRELALPNSSEPLGSPGLSHSYTTPTVVSPATEAKILRGALVAPGKRDMTGGHSPSILKDPAYQVEIISRNPDGTITVKWIKDISPDPEGGEQREEPFNASAGRLVRSEDHRRG